MRPTLATNEPDPLILDEEQVVVQSLELREAVSEPYELVLTLHTDDLALPNLEEAARQARAIADHFAR